jgi:hypothetical protein
VAARAAPASPVCAAHSIWRRGPGAAAPRDVRPVVRRAGEQRRALPERTGVRFAPAVALVAEWPVGAVAERPAWDSREMADAVPRGPGQASELPWAAAWRRALQGVRARRLQPAAPGSALRDGLEAARRELAAPVPEPRRLAPETAAAGTAVAAPAWHEDLRGAMEAHRDRPEDESAGLPAEDGSAPSGAAALRVRGALL